MTFELVSRSAVPDIEYLLGLAPGGRSATIWERYEAQLPQDGFGRLGLHCTLCLDGPCRISPFARGAPADGAERGVCGFDAAAMSLALAARSTALGLMELAPLAGAGAAGLLAAAAGIAGAATPGAGDSGEIASIIVSWARTAAAALVRGCASEVARSGSAQAAPRAAGACTVDLGLGHLDPASPSLLVGGAGFGPAPDELRGLLHYAEQQGVQVVAAAGSGAGLWPGGPPAVIDTGCRGLLADSGLVSAVFWAMPAMAQAARAAQGSGANLGPSGAPDETMHEVVESARRSWEACPRAYSGIGRSSPDALGPGRGAVTAVSLPVWNAVQPRTMLIAGSSRLRTPLGRGGLHQAFARISVRMGWRIAACGDAAFYLAPAASELPFSPAPLWSALALALSNPGKVAAIFPEPVRASELAAAVVMASGGVPVLVAAELPVVPAGLRTLCAAVGGRLTAGGGPAIGAIAGAGEGQGEDRSASMGGLGCRPAWPSGVVGDLAASGREAFAHDTLACLETWLARLDGDSARPPEAGAAGERGCGA